MRTGKDWQYYAITLHRKAREKRITLTEIAELSGVSQPSLSRYFNLVSCMSFDKVHAVAKVLGYDLALTKIRTFEQ